MDAIGSSTGDAVDAVSMTVEAPVTPRRSARRRGDAIYHGLSLLFSLSMVAIFAAIVLVLAATAWPAVTRLGPGFLTQSVWNSTTDVYGALAFIVGTLLTTFLALLLAVPISIAIAILLTEYAPPRLAAVLGVIVDVAAGIPTIVFGVWAIIVVVGWMRDTVEPALASVFGWFPLLDPNNSAAGITGFGICTASLVLAAMVFPTIVSITRNSFLATPNELREASLGVGATRWETATRVVVRQSRAGLLGAIVLASGRALGETMAVVYVIGAQPQLPQSLFDQGQTLATELFTQLFGGNAIPGTLTAAALYELGLVLLVLSLLTSVIGRLLTHRLAGSALITGGGR